jgi:hypothetical protein
LLLLDAHASNGASAALLLLDAHASNGAFAALLLLDAHASQSDGINKLSLHLL